MEDIFDIILTILIFILSIFGGGEDVQTNEIQIQDSVEHKINEIELIYNLEENMNQDLEIRFCPYQNCTNFMTDSIEDTNNKIKCAFYELDNIKVIDSFKFLANKNISVELIIDDKYLDEEYFTTLANFDNIKIYSDTKRGTRYNNYMHDKFCIIDNETIITGSANPTETGLYKNNNNIIKYESKYLSQNYDKEFDQMKSNKYGTNKISQLKYNNITLNYENETYILNTYFCPQDDCLSPILEKLENAKNEILFASFAFTHDDIASILKMKNYQGLNVSGILETRSQNLKGSDFKDLKKEFSFVLDTNKNTMHHKFFIIDEKIVITGSMNPSASGVKYNDENLLIIENEEIAKMYKKEFFNLKE